MGLEIVMCPDCKHCFSTRKEDPQCGECGLRFLAVSNAVISLRSQIDQNSKEHEKRIKKINGLLAKLSEKYKETGVTIQEIHKAVKD